MVWWSCPFLSSRSSVSASPRCSLESVGRVSLPPPPVHQVCASLQAGKKCSRQLIRVARAQQHRPGGRLHCGRISVHSCFFGEETPSGVRQQVRQHQLLCSLSVVATRQDGNPSWHQPLVLDSESVGVITYVPCCGAQPSLTTPWRDFLLTLFPGFLPRRSGLKRVREGLPHTSRVFREIPWTPGPRVLRHFGRTRKSPRGSDARISQNFLTSPAHGPGWPS